MFLKFYSYPYRDEVMLINMDHVVMVKEEITDLPRYDEDEKPTPRAVTLVFSRGHGDRGNISLVVCGDVDEVREKLWTNSRCF